MKGTGRRFVVDADVARGAADPARIQRGEAHDVRGLRMRDCLKALRDAEHIVVFSPAVMGEWREHQSPATRSWLARMTERRRVERVSEPGGDWIRTAIAETLQGGDAGVASKDAHLVALACDQDQRLLSGDGKAREKFVRLVPLPPLDHLHWVDPEWEAVRDWLLERAPDRPAWTLGTER